MKNVAEIKARADKVEVHGSRHGCFVLNPPVVLVLRSTGQVVHANSVDETGKYKGTVHTQELGFWRPVEQFDFPPIDN